MALSQQLKTDSGKVVVYQLVEDVETVDDVPPPPPHLKSYFKTVQDWLFYICDNDSPKKLIAEYSFGLFESPNEYILFLVGKNKYDESKNRSRTSIEFKPSKMYFKLPKAEYKDLNREQLLGKLTSRLRDFVSTDKFKTSFLAKANSIIFESNGQMIWLKK